MSPDDSEQWRTASREQASRARRPEMRISSRALPRFLAAYRAGGLDLPALLARCELPPDAATRPELDAPLELVRTLPEEIATALNHPFLGLEIARILPPTSFGLVELAARNSPTLRESLERLVRLSAMLNEVESFELVVTGAHAEVNHRVPGTRRALGRQGNELLMAWLVRLIGEITQRPWAAQEVCLAHSAPPDPKPLTQFFHPGVVRFAMGLNALRFPSADLDLPIATADHALLAMVDERAERSLGRGGADDVLLRIREEIRQELRTGRPTLQTVAAKLGSSPRTLQRRLDGQNTSFNSVLEETRLALAKEYLANPKLAMKEVAYWLGYSDQATFIRAFKRATGLTPLEFRNQPR